MKENEAVEILKKTTQDPGVSEELKEALQLMMPDLERMVPAVPFKGKAGSYMTYNCGYCHTGISEGSKFCYRCGRKVDLENSDIPAGRREVILDLPKEEEPAEAVKKKRTKDRDVDGQSSIFDMFGEDS